MSNFEPLLERNQAFAQSGGHQGLAPQPKLGVFVITCIDSRVDPAHILGAELGDALVLRNAGGRVTDGVIDEIAFIATLSETLMGDAAPRFEVVVLHHTQCGSAFLADDDFRNRYADRIGADEKQLARLAVVDPATTVSEDVARLLSAASISSSVTASGHVYDVDSGLVSTIVDKASAS